MFRTGPLCSLLSTASRTALRPSDTVTLLLKATCQFTIWMFMALQQVLATYGENRRMPLQKEWLDLFVYHRLISR